MAEKSINMRNRVILSVVIGGSILFSFLFGFLTHLSEKAHNPGVTFNSVKENYYFSLLILAIVLIIAFFLGFITWLLLRRNKRPEKIFYFIVFNLIGLVLLIIIDIVEFYKTWHYDKYQANIDHNELLARRNGGYLDTCITMVEGEIKKKGLSMNDFRILSYEYDDALATTPRDTTGRFYLFSVLYSTNRVEKKVRAASYLINFEGRIKEIYDVDTKNKMAEKQIKSLRQDIDKLKNVLEKHPDSANEDIKNIKQKLETNNF